MDRFNFTNPLHRTLDTMIEDHFMDLYNEVCLLVGVTRLIEISASLPHLYFLR